MSTVFEQRIFDFALLRGEIPPLLLLHFPLEKYQKINFGKYNTLFISTNDTWQIKTCAQGREFLFIGSVFNFDENKPENSDGYFIAFTRMNEERDLHLFRNKNSQLGIYYYSNPHQQIIFSNLFSTQRILKLYFNIQYSEDNIADFLNFGFISLGQTPFSHIYQLPSRQQLKIIDNEILLNEEALLQLPKESYKDAKACFELIQNRFELWLTNTHFKSIAISGGIDSRLIIATLINKKINKKISLHSRLHPNLTPEEDMDVFLAQYLAKQTNYPFYIQHATDLPSAYLSQESVCQTPVMSGLYGGEFLGGEFLNLVSIDFLEKQNLVENSPFATKVLSRAKAQVGQDTHILKLDILSDASLCSVYNGAWLTVASHHNLTLTPFLDSYCKELIKIMNPLQIKDYKLYREIYSYLPDKLLRTPLNSQMNVYYNDYPHALVGKNPKKVPFHIEQQHISEETYDTLPQKLRHLTGDKESMNLFQNFLNLSHLF